MYFVLLVLFIVLFFGPLIAARFFDFGSLGKGLPLDLLQPTGQNNNDTNASITGSNLVNFGDGAAATGGGDSGSGGGGGGGGDTATDVATGVFSFGGRMAARWVTVA